MRALVAEIRAEVCNDGLIAVVRDVEATTDSLLGMNTDERLAASATYLTLVSIMVCGWLVERQGRIAHDLVEAMGQDTDFLRWKIASADYYLAQIVPRAMGLATAVAVDQSSLKAIFPVC